MLIRPFYEEGGNVFKKSNYVCNMTAQHYGYHLAKTKEWRNASGKRGFGGKTSERVRDAVIKGNTFLHHSCKIYKLLILQNDVLIGLSREIPYLDSFYFFPFPYIHLCLHLSLPSSPLAFVSPLLYASLSILLVFRR